VDLKAPQKGVIHHTNKDKLIANEGPSKKKLLLPTKGVTISLENNLMASLNGCTNPTNPTLLGPLRSCEYPRIFRSKRVIKATLTKTGINNKTILKLIIITPLEVRKESSLLLTLKANALNLPP
jgi:hypothetical protein